MMIKSADPTAIDGQVELDLPLSVEMIDPPAMASSNTDSVADHRGAVESVINSMHEHLGRTWSLEKMAEIAVLSPFHFNRVFRYVTGIPPAQFLWALRIQLAKRLLVDTELSVTDICFEVGYSSLGTFSSRFTHLVGASPQQFRRLTAQVANLSLSALHRAECRPYASHVDGIGINGEIFAPQAFHGPIVIALFTRPLPQSHPVRCDLLTVPGSFCITSVPDGEYYLFAIGLPWSNRSLPHLIRDRTRYFVGASRRPLQVQNGQAEGLARVVLRRVQLTDPPILVAVPLLLAERIDAL